MVVILCPFLTFFIEVIIPPVSSVNIEYPLLIIDFGLNALS